MSSRETYVLVWNSAPVCSDGAQEYSREKVSVHPLGDFTPLVAAEASPNVDASFVPAAPAPLPSAGALPAAIPASVYLWTNPLSELHPELWSFDTFVRENAWKWIGDGASDNKDYKAVDEIRWEGRATP
jgi:hypothetical protein